MVHEPYSAQNIVRQHFSRGKALRQARGTVVFIVVVDTEENEIHGPVVGGIVIEMRDLPLAFVAVARARPN